MIVIADELYIIINYKLLINACTGLNKFTTFPETLTFGDYTKVARFEKNFSILTVSVKMWSIFCAILVGAFGRGENEIPGENGWNVTCRVPLDVPLGIFNDFRQK